MIGPAGLHGVIRAVLDQVLRPVLTQALVVMRQIGARVLGVGQGIAQGMPGQSPGGQRAIQTLRRQWVIGLCGVADGQEALHRDVVKRCVSGRGAVNISNRSRRGYR